jgi:hypothetical protein
MGTERKFDIDLTPEARIIAEDDTHATIAVRVDKQWLARNLHFIAALLDSAILPAILPWT